MVADMSAQLRAFCYACGQPIDPRAEICLKCGVRQRHAAAASAKSRVVAALLAIFLGGIGAHRFYLGHVGLGLLYLFFFWTFVPAIIGFIEGLVYLATSDEDFAAKYGRG